MRLTNPKSSTLYLIAALGMTASAIVFTIGAAAGIVDDLTAITGAAGALFSYTTYLYAPGDDGRMDDDDDSGHPETAR
jgi:hypothetical protein